MTNVPEFEQKLLAEKKRLEAELNSLGRRDPKNPAHWQTTPTEEGMADDRDEVADRLEDFAGREAAEGPLEKELLEVNAALERIKAGTYGLCEVGNEPIEPDRLAINPSARTCVKHMNG